MDVGLRGLETATLHPVDAATKARQRAESVAHQFEDVLVRSLVSAMRQTATIDGEGGGMFGGEPGADTYADWFDEHVASELGRSGRIGVADVLMREFERWKQIPGATEAEASAKNPEGLLQVDASVLRHEPLHAIAGGGLDVAL